MVDPCAFVPEVEEEEEAKIGKMKIANYIANCETGAAYLKCENQVKCFLFLIKTYNFLIIKPFDNHIHVNIEQCKEQKKKEEFSATSEMRKSIGNSHCVSFFSPFKINLPPSPRFKR